MWSQLCGNHYTHVVHENMDCNMEKLPECWSVGWRLVFHWFRREGLMRNCQSSSDYAFQAMHSKVPWSVPLYIYVGITPDKSLSHNTSRICFQLHERFKKQPYFFISPTSRTYFAPRRYTQHQGNGIFVAHSPHGNYQIKRLTFNW